MRDIKWMILYLDWLCCEFRSEASNVVTRLSRAVRLVVSVAEQSRDRGEVRGGQQVDREEATLGGGYRQSVVWWWGLYSCCTLYVTPSLYFRVWSSSSQQQQVAPLIPLIILRCFRLSWHQTSLVARRMWGLRWTMDFSSSSGRWREAGMQWAGGSSDCDPDIIQLSSCRETGWQLSGL